jgi:adenylyltransferase/sulfurtransferase
MDQERPLQRIVVVGAGGTGCALLPMLLAIRPGRLHIVDGDTVEAENLHRQPLFGPGDIGRPKALAALERIQHQCIDTALEATSSFIDADNAQGLLAGSTVVADCTDDIHVRLLLDRVCGELRIPLVSGAVHAHQVQVGTMHHAYAGAERGHALRDWFPGGIGPAQDGCDMREVPAAVTAIAAACMALRIQAVLGGDGSLSPLLDLIDTRNGMWMRMRAPHDPNDGELIAQDGTGHGKYQCQA